MKRCIDFFLSLVGILLLSVSMLMIAVLVKLTSKGPVLYCSNRVGVNNTLFEMYKFRTMKVDTPVVATHLMANPDAHLTSIGRFLRKTSLDEFPQLFNILKGDMSFVGPRPALFNQDDLIELNAERDPYFCAGLDWMGPGEWP